MCHWGVDFVEVNSFGLRKSPDTKSGLELVNGAICVQFCFENELGAEKFLARWDGGPVSG